MLKNTLIWDDIVGSAKMENPWNGQMQVIIEKVSKENDLPLNGLRMRGSRKFCQRGPTLTFYFCFLFFFFFFLMRGGRIQIPLLAGHQRPASETPFKWRFAGGPMVAQH